MSERFENFRQFNPYYLSGHADVCCRRLHFIGSWLVLVTVALAIFVSP